MKVLYVIDALGEGGTELSLAELLPSLIARGVDPTVVTLRERTEEGVHAAVESMGVPVLRLRRASMARQVWELRRAILGEDVELVHSMLFASDVRARAACRLTGCPLVNSLVSTTYARDLAEPSRRGRMKRALVRGVDGTTARWVSAFHAVSRPVRRDAVLGLHLEPGRIAVVERSRSVARLGEASPERRSAVRERLGISGSTPLVVSVGRQEPQKGHLTLLRALPTVLSSVPDLRVLVAGRPGTSTAAIDAAVSADDLGEVVSFLGHRGDIPDLLAAADLFVLPSRFEGMPGALLEAMGLGLTAVASDIDPVAEVVEPGHNALLVPVDDPDALGAAIVELLGDDGRRAAMGRRSKEIFDRRFSSDAAGDGMVELYRRAMAGEPAASTGRVAPPHAIHGVLVTYRRPDELRNTLSVLAQQSRPLDSLFVVDNGNDPDTASIARQQPSARQPTRVVVAPSNLGPAGGYALATRQLLSGVGPGDWILFLDDDDPPSDRGAVAELVDFASRSLADIPHLAAVGNAGARFDVRNGRLRRLEDDELVGAVPVDYVPGGHLLLVSSSALAEAGTFDPGLFFGFDDLELGLRLRRFGFDVRANGAEWLAARRRLGRTGPRVRPVARRVSAGRRYYAVRNQIVVTRRYGTRTAALRATAANLIGRPAADVLRGRPAVSLWRASIRGAADAWTDVTGPTVPLDQGPE